MPRKVEPPNTLTTFLKREFPLEMSEFDKAPWDYSVYFSSNLEDLPLITVYLKIGKKRTERIYRVEYNIVTKIKSSTDVTPTFKTKGILKHAPISSNA